MQVLSRTRSYQTNGMISRARSSGYESWLRPTERTVLCSISTAMQEERDINKNDLVIESGGDGRVRGGHVIDIHHANGVNSCPVLIGFTPVCH